jgi:hypothetical protein
MVHAPEKPAYPIATVDTLTEFDAFVFGVPTRFGNMSVQWKVRPRCLLNDRLRLFRAQIDPIISRHFGMALVLSGLKVLWLENMQVFSSPQTAWEEAKKQPALA